VLVFSHDGPIIALNGIREKKRNEVLVRGKRPLGAALGLFARRPSSGGAKTATPHFSFTFWGTKAIRFLRTIRRRLVAGRAGEGFIGGRNTFGGRPAVGPDSREILDKTPWAGTGDAWEFGRQRPPPSRVFVAFPFSRVWCKGTARC